MPSRFYFEASGSVPGGITPATDIGWSATANGFVRVPANLTPAGTALANIGDTTNTNLNSQNMVCIQAIAGPYPAQTYANQTVKFSLQANEVEAGCNLFVFVMVRMLAEDNLAELGQLPGSAGVINSLTEVAATTMTARTRSMASGTDQVIAESHYLVFELGLSGNPSSTGHQGLLRMGTTAAGGDLPENDTDTTTNKRGWFEFTNAIVEVGESATLAATVTEPTFAGTGAQTQTSTVAATLQKALFAGTNAQFITGTSAPAMQKATFAGTAVVGSLSGVMSATMQEPTFAGLAEVEGPAPPLPTIAVNARYAPVVQ